MTSEEGAAVRLLFLSGLRRWKMKVHIRDKQESIEGRVGVTSFDDEFHFIVTLA